MLHPLKALTMMKKTLEKNSDTVRQPENQEYIFQIKTSSSSQGSNPRPSTLISLHGQNTLALSSKVSGHHRQQTRRPVDQSGMVCTCSVSVTRELWHQRSECLECCCSAGVAVWSQREGGWAMGGRCRWCCLRRGFPHPSPCQSVNPCTCKPQVQWWNDHE